MIRFLFVLLLGGLPAIHGYSQVAEICNNGIDDDFDGFIDCYDGSCANSPNCDGLFLGNDASCQAIPPAFPKFTMTLDFSSPNETTNHLARMVIGDYDRDGMPEIATMNRYTNKLFILRGNNGAIKHQATVDFEPYWEIATANIDNDNCAELFYIGYLEEISHTEKINKKNVTIIDRYEGIYMFAYDCQLNFLWRTVEPFPDGNDPINYGVADFDGDGLVEIYAKDEIYDAKTGVRLVKSTAADYTEINGGPVAVNMLGDSKLELVLGLAIYDVDLTNRTLDNGKLTLLKGRNDYFIRFDYNATSVADYNLDGFLDVIASGSTGSHGKNTTVFYWDVKNDALKTYSDPQPGLGTDYKNGWINGTGRLNVADLDGDGKMNVSFVSGRFLYALNENFGLFWKHQINEETSGHTGCTLFDFNGDGKAEIVYRDEKFLYIINGTDGTNYQNPQTCVSRTNREYPIVADVDADGSTEICVPCGFNDASATANFNTLSYSRYSHIRVFKSAAEPWVPARRIWNQHGYFIVNVNDDLTIPKTIQAHHLVWSTGSCTTGPNRPLNKFLNQSPFLNSKGCPTYAAINLTFSGIKPTIIPPQCPNPNYTVSMQIVNLGDVSLTGNIPISFYTKNPKKAGATWLTTINVPVTDLTTNETLNINNLSVNGGGSDSLYLVLNDAGTTIPTPISLPNGTFFECDYTDNVVGAAVVPLPVKLTGLEVNPNNACVTPANGAARAFVLTAGVENTANYNFYWFNGTVAKPIAAANFVGPIYSGVPNGTYTVYARHKTQGCSSDTVQVVVGLVPDVPTVNITVASNQTSCVPPNGKLTALVVGGNAGFTFNWFDVSLTPLGITGPVANGLVAGTYVVFASRNGCSKSSAPATIAGPLIPDAQGTVLTHITDCNNLNSGSIKADALVSGVIQNPANYTFDWYFYNNATSTRGSILPPANGTGQTRTGLAAGYYQAVVKENASQCVSGIAPIVQVLDQRVFPTAAINQVAAQTSCDPANPNGILSADALIAGVVQNPAGFTFEWFKGDNTLPANAHTFTSGVNGQVANKVAGGGVFYTVRVTSASHCSATNKLIITENINKPVVTLTSTANSICDPAIAGTAFNGTVSASVTFAGSPVGTFTNYKFIWHNGSLVTDPVIAVGNNQLPSLGSLNGGYYTVEVQRTDLGCTSVPVTVQVLNGPVLPVIVTNNTPSTNCTGAANGILDAKVDLGAGVTTTTGYTFKWFKGNSIASPLVGSTPNVTGQQGGQNYTVQVINSASGCPNTLTALLPNASALPVIALTPAPNSVCNPALTSPPVNFNGSVTAAATYKGAPVGSFADYTFTWHNGSLATDPVNGSSTTQNLTAVNGGFYTVTATIVSLGCTSNAVTSQVLNSQIIPAITTNTAASTNCNPLQKNGQAFVTDLDGAGVGAPYTFKWYDGSSVVPGSEKALTAAYGSVQGGVGKNYTVLVTNQGSGCQNNKTVLVADGSILPTVSLVAAPNSICNPALTSPAAQFSGSVTATVTNQIGVIGDYSFTWHAGALVTDPVDGGSTTSVLGNKNGGSYTVTTLHVPTGCVSSPKTAAVANTQVIPAITTATISSTNCDPLLKNGQASVSDVDGVGNGAPFVFKWYDGVAVVPGSEKSLTAAYNSVQGGAGQNYTVQVTNQSSGCQNNKTVQVADAKVLPVVTLSKTDNTRCIVPKDGTATVNTLTYQAAPVAAPYAGYTFSWSNGATTSTINALAAANYTLTVTNTSVGCASSPVSVTVNDNLYIPVVNVAKTAQTSCDVANPNGILAATIDETTIGGGGAVTGGYNFIWHNGTQVTDPTVTTTTGIPGEVNKLNGNLDYLVEATRTISGCKNTFTVFLQETVVLPAVALTTVTALTRCDTPNGSILTTVTQVPVQTYTYFWMKEPTSSATTNPNTVITAVNASPAFPNRKNTGAVAGNTDTFGSLIPGDYTIVVVDNYTTCISQPVTGTVVDNSLKSVITITLGPTFPSTCGVADGQMSASIAGGVGPYDMQWHRTGPTNTNINFFTNPPVFTPPNDVPFQTNLSVTNATANTLASGVFSLVIKDVGNGCGNYETVFLPFLAAHTITPILTPSTVCPTTSGNGNVKVTLGNIPGGRTFQDFTYVLYTGENPDPAKQVGAVLGPGASVTNPENFPSALPPGMYTVEVRQAFSGLCPTFKVVEILQDALSPVVTLVGAIQANTACDVLQADGSVVIDIQKDPDDATVGSTYSLNVNPLPVGGGFPVAGLGIGNRAIGGLKPIGTVPQYTITVTSSNNCVTQRLITVPDQPAVSQLVAGNVTVTDAALCSPSGSVEVTAISIIGAGADNLNNFRFDWFNNIGLTTNVFSAQGNNTGVKGGEFLDNTTFPTISPGSYWVTATKNIAGQPGFGCTSSPFKADIDDVSVDPVVAMNAFTNTACDNNYEGKVTVQVSDPSGPGVGSLYTYVWDPANPVVIASTNNNNGNSINDGDGDNPLNLKEGTYKVTVTNNVTSCVSLGQVSLVQTATPIVLTNATVVDKDICSPDGSVTVGANDVTVNGVVDATHTNFIFDWFLGAPTGAPIVTGNNIDALTVGNYPTIGAGDYYVTVTRASGVPLGSGCKSAPLKKTINDISIKPTVALAAFSNTSCDTNYEGRLTVTTSDSGGPGVGSLYTYVWDPANPVAIPSTINNNGNAINDGDGDNPLNMKEGTYIVKVTNNLTACETTGQVSLLQNATPIVVANATTLDKQLCAPDGSITVGANDVTVNGAADPVHTNFVFDWRSNSPTGPVVLTGVAADVLNNVSFPAIAAGDYYIVATRAAGVPSGSGCNSAPFKRTIKDITITPVVSFTTVANTACDNNFDASITVISATPSGPGVGSTYNLTWTSVPAGSSVANASNVGGAYSTAGPDVVGPGTFSITVINNTTQCVVAGSVSVLSNPQSVDILTVNKTDQSICYPDGSITVASLNSGVVGNYTYNWFRNDPTTPPLVDAGSATIVTPALSIANYPTIGAGTYFVVATKNGGAVPGSGCKTPPFRKDILDTHKDPRLQFAFTPNSSCDNLNPNATVLANAAEQSGVNSDTYSFAWTRNAAVLPPVTTQTNTNNSSQLAQGFEGTYKLTIVNVTTTGCQFTSSVNVDLNLNISLPNVIGVNKVDPIDCLPSGSASVSSVSIGGGPAVTGPALTTSFTYEWYANNFTPADILPTTTPTIAGLAPRSYFVLVKDNSTLCKSGPREVQIVDTNIIYPVVTITQTAKQISCTLPGTASLSADAIEQNGSLGAYSFTWYSSLDLSGPILTGPSPTNPNVIGSLSVGNFSIEVQNTATACKASALYIVPDDVPQFRPKLALSSQPHTLCTAQDGFVLASVVAIEPTYPFPLSYTSDLYFGANPNLGGPPDVPAMGNVPGFTTNFVQSALPDGIYTVRITDNNTSCTAVDTVSVLDARKYPAPTVDIIVPNVNCDPTNPNGVARVLVGGQFVGFQFDWYEGTTVAGAPVYVGPEFGSLKPKDYIIQATNLTTGCTGTVKTLIPNGSLPIPLPDITKISDVTSCIVDNGILSVSVGPDKVTFEYVFEWHNGSTENPPPEFIGEIYSDLSSGTYSVTATSKITGCKSPLVSADIIEDKVYPDFDFHVISPSCGNNNGSATLLMTSDVPVEKIEWANGTGPFQVGPNLTEVVAGTYEVTVTSLQGCATTKDIEIIPDVRPFNGISRNPDGQNDFFQIDCIQDFPNNIVKIYNRAGTLVFEAIGYDNSTVLFDGKSNRGVSVMGTHLPDGTYFYIIDKRNGSKPIAGYLEIVQ